MLRFVVSEAEIPGKSAVVAKEEQAVVFRVL
jgi:hypothetical protein